METTSDHTVDAPVTATSDVAPSGADRAPAINTVAGSVDPILPVVSRSRRRGRRIGLWLAIAWLVVVAGMSILANWLPLHPYDRFTDLRPRTAPGFRWKEFLGTDATGRSILTRVTYGARQSLEVGLITVAISATVGTVLGLVAGYMRGKVDEVIGIVLDALLAIPALVLLLAIAAIGSRNLTTLIIGLSILLIAPFARLVRANTLAFADREFVLAARAMGATRRRIMFREILPNVIPAVISVVFLYAASIVVAEGTLSFLGLGIPPPKPSWGGMINEGRQYLNSSPALVFIPSAVLLFTVISLRVIGENIRGHFGKGSSV